MNNEHRPPRPTGTVRKLNQREELPLLRDHLLRLDSQSRYDRFHGFLDDEFMEKYAAKCAADGTVVLAYLEKGLVRGAAELHPPHQSAEALPEIAFSVETSARQQGIGTLLFTALIAEARKKGYRRLRITTGAQNNAMRALAKKFGAHLDFRHGESTGTIDLVPLREADLATWGSTILLGMVRAMINLNRAYWRHYLNSIGLGPTAQRRA